MLILFGTPTLAPIFTRAGIAHPCDGLGFYLRSPVGQIVAGKYGKLTKSIYYQNGILSECINSFHVDDVI